MIETADGWKRGKTRRKLKSDRRFTRRAADWKMQCNSKPFSKFSNEASNESKFFFNEIVRKGRIRKAGGGSHFRKF